jgi:cupin 2 domain-containing protein
MNPSCSNLFAHKPVKPLEEWIEPLLQAGAFRLERIVSNGSRTTDGAWYDQANAEWVVLLKGKARIRFEDLDEIIELSPGDFIEIPAHRRHRVEWTTPDETTIWLAAHYSP